MIVNMATGEEQPLMRAEFDFTHGDLLDVLLRSPSFAVLQKRLGGWVLLLGAVVFCASIPFWVRDASLADRAVISVIFAALVVCQRRPMARRWAERFLRRQADAVMARTASARCVVELMPGRLVCRQIGITLGWDWPLVLAVEERGDDVEFRSGRSLEHASMLVVRGRAFATPAQRAAFLALARRLHAAARAPAAITPSASS